MRIFDFLKPRERVAVEPRVGEWVWWHSRQHVVQQIDRARGVFVFENDYHRVTASLADARWNDLYKMWYLPGTEDQTPKLVRGEWVFPRGAHCVICGRATLRELPCRECAETPAGIRWILNRSKQNG